MKTIEEIIPEGIEAIIYDIDGTLLDTMPVHYKACNKVCEPEGFTFPLSFFIAKAGMPTHEVFELLQEEVGLSFDWKKLADEKEEAYKTLIHHIKRNNELCDLAIKHFGNLPQACGTGATKEIADLNLKASGMDNYFDIVITADDVEHHKPAPDTFLKCAKLMNIAPEKCLVFEDGLPGIKAAEAAGMHVIDVNPFVEISYT